MSIVRPADQGWKPTPGAELAHLRLCWGRLYQIGHDPAAGQWAARHLQAGEQLIARDPLEIRRLIRDDWNHRQPKSGWNSS